MAEREGWKKCVLHGERGKLVTVAIKRRGRGWVEKRVLIVRTTSVEGEFPSFIEGFCATCTVVAVVVGETHTAVAGRDLRKGKSRKRRNGEEEVFGLGLGIVNHGDEN